MSHTVSSLWRRVWSFAKSARLWLFGFLNSQISPPLSTGHKQPSQAALALGLKGHLDLALPDRVEGWVIAGSNPAGRRHVELFLAETRFAQVKSDYYRDDLNRAGIGDGRHAFRYLIRPPLPAGEHIVRVLDAETGIELNNSPQIVIVPDDHHLASPYRAYADWKTYIQGRTENQSNDLHSLAAIMRNLAQIMDFSAISEIYDILQEKKMLPITRSNRNHGAIIFELVAYAKARWGQPDQAIRICEHAVDMFSEHAPLRRVLALLLRAIDPQRAHDLLAEVRDCPSFQQDVSSLIVMADIAAQLQCSVARRAEIRRRLLGGSSPELLLQLANLESGTDDKLFYLNDYLQRQGLTAVALCGPSGSFLERLRTKGEDLAPDGPLVSVIMTSHNSERHLATSIGSILNQTYRNFELLVVDDASADNSVTLIQRLSEQDHRVRLLTSSVNAGTYVAKNRALQIAAGALVTCQDSDDWAHPQKLEWQIKSLTEHPNLVANWSRWVRLDDNGLFTLQSWGLFTHLNPASLMFRREAVLQSVGFFDSVRTGADSEFRQRLTCKFGPFAIAEVSETLTLGRQHDSSLTNHGPAAFVGDSFPPVRRAYINSWLDWHYAQLQDNGDFKVTADVSQRLFAAPAAILPESGDWALEPEAFRRLHRPSPIDA